MPQRRLPDANDVARSLAQVHRDGPGPMPLPLICPCVPPERSVFYRRVISYNPGSESASGGTICVEIAEPSDYPPCRWRSRISMEPERPAGVRLLSRSACASSSVAID